MAKLEWVDEVREMHVDPEAQDGPTIEDVNQALSQGWRLLEVYPYHSGSPRARGARATAYVLGRAKKRETRTTTLPGPGASGVPGPGHQALRLLQLDDRQRHLELRSMCGRMPIGLTTIEVVLGAIIAIITTITVENLRKPKLELGIAPPKDMQYDRRPANQGRFLYLELANRALPRWARWMSRGAAMQCHGSIAFHHLDGQNVFGRVMAIRWSGSPEPVAMTGVVDGKEIQLVDPVRLTIVSKMDVYPGEAERLDVAARFDNDDECYGWSNESYFSDTPWRNPDWKLPPGRYLVKVTVISAGEKCTGVFRLVNDVPRQDFRLEPALPGDSVRD